MPEPSSPTVCVTRCQSNEGLAKGLLLKNEAVKNSIRPNSKSTPNSDLTTCERNALRKLIFLENYVSRIIIIIAGLLTC